MPSLGNASLILSSSGEQLLAGLSKAGNDIGSWAGSTVNKISSAFGPVGKAVGAAFGVGIALATTAIGTIETKLKELSGIQKRADVLGISASQLQGISLQLEKVGISGREVNSLFAKMGKNIADSAGGHGRAAPALAQLGIDAKALMALKPDKQFEALADAIAKLPPGSAQASAALHIFGDEGQRLLPILQKGGAGIQAWIEEQKKSGNVLGDDQIRAAANAQKAWKEAKANITEAWNGLVNRVVVALAPVLEVLGRVLRGLTKSVGEFVAGWDAMGTVIDWTKALAISLAYVWDTLKAGLGFFEAGLGVIVHGIGVAIDGFVAMVDLMKELPDDIRPKGLDSFIKGVDDAARDTHAVGDELIKSGAAKVDAFGNSAKQVEKWFSNIGKKSKETVKDLKQDAAVVMADYHAVAAVLQGSTSAYSAQVKFDFESQFGAQQKIPEAQLGEQRKTNGLLQKVLDKFGNEIKLQEV